MKRDGIMEKKWVVMCGLGGILMILGSVTGDVSIYRMVFDIASDYLNGDFAPLFAVVLSILGFIASGGGFTVIVGTGLIAKGYNWIGKFVVGLGAGMGIVGLLILVANGIISGNLLGRIFPVGPGFAGVLLTILSRLKL